MPPEARWRAASINKGDAVDSLFGKDGDEISVYGFNKVGTGKFKQTGENVRKMGISITTKLTDIRPLPGGQAALENGTYTVHYKSNPTTTAAEGNWLRVLVKEGSEWKIEAQDFTREPEATATGSTTKQ